MFDKLKRFLHGEPPPIAEKIDDPILGFLTWSDDDEAWISDAAYAGAGIGFMISGTPEPDKVLLAHAADILRQKDAFVTEVLAHVKSEAEDVRSFRPYLNEIAGLRVEQVCLFWPDRPDDGLIVLSGGRDYRAWRCNYLARKPQGLGFDS